MMDNVLLLLLLGSAGVFLLGCVAALGMAAAWVVGWLVERVTRGQERSGDFVRISKRLTVGGFVAFLVYQTYFAVYPQDDFYFGEFAVATLRNPPEEAVVVGKDASYPDFHGDYCSFSRIRVAGDSYRRLMEELNSDAKLAGTEGKGFASAGTPALKRPSIGVVRRFRRTDLKPDHHHAVYFLEDGVHIDVQICVT